MLHLRAADPKAGEARFLPLPGGRYSDQPAFFDAHVYKARMAAVIRPFLCDANDRAACAGKRAHVRVCGLGLGVWKLVDRQTQLQEQAYFEALQELSLLHVATVELMWFRSAAVPAREIVGPAGNAVSVVFSKSDPAAPVEAGCVSARSLYGYIKLKLDKSI